ncbi:MAG: hypothetical protein HC824_10090 [Synechococcales cyanobacterium RM1_1_8]|nr:hypothetical protein [Synechococcales cyanobacterium RM1_1_8]
MGCFECQRIFVVVEDGWAIAKLSANSPRQLRWRWTGEEWYLASSPWPSYFLAIALAITLGLVCMGIFLTLLPPPSAKPLMRLMLTGIAFMLVLVLGTFLSHRPWRG